MAGCHPDTKLLLFCFMLHLGRQKLACPFVPSPFFPVGNKEEWHPVMECHSTVIRLLSAREDRG